MAEEPTRPPRRDHIVAISNFYSLAWVLKMISSISILPLLYPYKGPEPATPSYLHFMSCAVSEVCGGASCALLYAT